MPGGTSRFPRNPLPWSADADRRLRRLPYRIQEQFVHPRIFRQLWMKRGDEDPAVAHEDRLAVVLGENLHLSTG